MGKRRNKTKTVTTGEGGRNRVMDAGLKTKSRRVVRPEDATTKSLAPSLSLMRRKKKKKFLPILLCAGLSYSTFCERSSSSPSEIGLIPLTAAESPERGTTIPIRGNNNVQHDHDLVIFDDEPVVLTDQSSGSSENGYTEKPSSFRNTEEQSDSAHPVKSLGIIVVAAVDGTLAGISKETGEVLWKQCENVEAMKSPLSSSSLMKAPRGSSSNKGFNEDTSQILKPLMSTTTTTKSASDATYKAVPSIDGTIYTTTNEISMTASVKELVAKSPFLDPRGKFYVGSRHASAAALDAETGQILRVIPSSTKDADDETLLPALEGRDIIWIGRIDREISVQDAKTGLIDAQFSVAEIMSVADMRGTMGKDIPEHPIHYGGSSSLTSATSALTTTSSPSNGDIESSSALVATPNGNVALWNFADEEFSWVAKETFDSPIAYAMDGTTGQLIGLDIIPDVTDPCANIDDLTREMERQSETASLSDTPVVGAMTNGQLFALPLRRKRRYVDGEVSGTSIASTSSSLAAGKSSGNAAMHTVSQLPGRPHANFHPTEHSSSNNNYNQQQQQQQYHQNSPEQNSVVMVAKKTCVPNSPTFPSCLLESHNERRILAEGLPAIGDNKYNQQQPQEGGSLVITTPTHDNEDGGFFHPQYGYVSPKDLGGFYHPEFGFVSPRDLYGTPKRTNKRSEQKILRVLGSWLPPFIALVFVVSFELGRRKRLKDEQKDQTNFFLSPEQMDKVNGTVTFDEYQQRVLAEKAKQQRQEVISVSEDVLGYGGHGTVVYKGVLDGRNVAVKRMLKAYHASADREISLLIESDGDPNVVRYFLKEVRGDFVYLALELCDLSLHELIGVLREKYQEQGLFNSSSSSAESNSNETALSCAHTSESANAIRRILFQIASGVKHLHSLRIVHRDLKPANILLAVSKGGKKKVKEDDPIFTTFVKNYYDAKISDMGLGKQLIGQSSIGASFIGESSFRGTKSGANSVGVGPGTVGWQAPEVMAMRLTSDTSARSMDGSTNNHSNSDSKDCQAASDSLLPGIRTSRSVDIFSLGCIFYSLLIIGHHPFGEWFEREANIMHNRPNLNPLKKVSSEAYHLIRSMLDRKPRLRPTAKEVCQHPFFWNPQKKLTFLCDFSDRLETDLIAQASSSSSLNVFNTLAIERGAAEIVGTSWEARLHSALIDNVQKFRTYDYSCVRDLLRLIRNKHHHYEELPEEFRLSTVPNQDALYEYFSAKFPALIMHCYSFCRQHLTVDDQMVSKFEISLAKPDTAVVTKEVSATSASVTLKKKEQNVVSDEEIISIDPTGFNVPTEEAKCIVIEDDVCTEVVTDDGESNGYELDDDIVVWEGSIAAKTYNCRGWHRSQDEWSRHIEPFYKKRDPASKRCMEDPKFRTRLCNHWDMNSGTFCPMRKKNKCVFAHGPAELRVKEGKKNRWGKLVDKNGNNSNPMHSGGEDTYGAASSIEKVRKEEGKWNSKDRKKNNQGATPRRNKKNGTNNQTKPKTSTPKQPSG